MSKVYTFKSREKKGSNKPEFEGNLAQGLNRRAFIRSGSQLSLLAMLAACKPKREDTAKPEKSTHKSEQPDQSLFDGKEARVIKNVQQHMFPDDGNGPDAEAINAFGYLEFAMTDRQNIEDGDPEFLKKGIGWLQDLSISSQGEDYLKLAEPEQVALLKKISASSAGENWLALIIYYLAEALMLDPVYGGNPEQVGWRWLEHQAGFPRPVEGKTYRDFD
ncbi:gluconate 2-dehydrogenase subunit 3 family protein [Aliikangiella sp. G2MR2-5]|uniref:gluconate 2-dehydrogenase subunit 3 family protein n=1 Tax=Aliikangiella sp. G2MR2-5 TaxID=2788943 RepID=UPI0018A9AF3F|nr:gluconate 2-dehydrogenase subunit 3 family protein [Aliikangiella sp. G2MR2-5]